MPPNPWGFLGLASWWGGEVCCIACVSFCHLQSQPAVPQRVVMSWVTPRFLSSCSRPWRIKSSLPNPTEPQFPHPEMSMAPAGQGLAPSWGSSPSELPPHGDWQPPPLLPLACQAPCWSSCHPSACSTWPPNCPLMRIGPLCFPRPSHCLCQGYAVPAGLEFTAAYLSTHCRRLDPVHLSPVPLNSPFLTRLPASVHGYPPPPTPAPLSTSGTHQPQICAPATPTVSHS